jgi:hypothetical protein
MEFVTEFVTEFLQFTCLEPSIYRLKENINLLKIRLWLSSVRTGVSLVRTVFCDRVWKGILKFLKFLQAVLTFLLAVQIFKLYYFFWAFQRHQLRLNPILEQRVMINTLRHVHKSFEKPEMFLDGVALPSGRLLFPDLCLNMKSNSL